MACLARRTVILIITISVSLLIAFVPGYMWVRKIHDYHNVKRTISAQFDQDIIDAQPVLEMQCRTLDDMERYDSGKYCRELRLLVSHATPEKREQFIEHAVYQELYVHRGEFHTDYLKRAFLVCALIATVCTLCAFIHFWTASDAAVRRTETLPTSMKKHV